MTATIKIFFFFSAFSKETKASSRTSIKVLFSFLDLYVHHSKMPQTIDVGMMDIKDRGKMHKFQKDLEREMVLSM